MSRRRQAGQNRARRTSDDDWLAEIPARSLLERGLEARFALPPGDRSLVEPDAVVAAGDPLLEHQRHRHLEEVDARTSEDAAGLVAGARWSPPPGRHRHGQQHEGELLAPVPGKRGRWRLAGGDQHDPIESPLTGRVSEISPGGEIRIRAAAPALRGAFAAGSAARGPLVLATDPFGDLRPGGIDVSRAGTILVVGARIDAEALTRARAMGVRGIVVATLPGKELRDFRASERRQRAALHQAQPFGVLVLEGAIRRPIPGPVAALFERVAGSQVALLVDPPALVFDGMPALGDGDLPVPWGVSADWVRIRSGPNAGLEGRLVGLVGPLRFAAGVVLEAARVAIEGRTPIDIPVADLERLV